MGARIKVVVLFSLDIDFEGSFLVWSWDFEEWGFLVGKGGVGNFVGCIRFF